MGDTSTIGGTSGASTGASLGAAAAASGGNPYVMAGMVALSAISSASAQRQAGKAQQRVAEYNAGIAELQALDAIARGKEAVLMHRQDTRQLIGSQRAAFAASGVDISDTDSTATNVIMDTARQSKTDERRIKFNAAREAWGFRVQASDAFMRGSVARQEGRMGATATLLNAGGNFALRRYGWG